MLSPFAFSYRRRSHSASSPSPSPVPASSWRPSHKRAHSSHRDTPTLPDAQRCHLDVWRTGKRARRDVSPLRATRSSTPVSADSTASSSSAPHTPLFPASSADFLLFPSQPLRGGNVDAFTSYSPSSAVALHDDSCESSLSELARLRSEAFSELQKSVQENGEGFVKRMREFEDSRSKSVQHSRPRGIERQRKKRYSPSVPTTRATGKVSISDDDNDILIFSSAFSCGESSYPRQRRSSSLGAMDDSDFQPYDTSDSGRLSPISSSIFHSLSFPNSAVHVHTSTTNQSSELPTSFSTSFDFTSLRHTTAFRPIVSHPSSDSLASSTDVFVSSSYSEDADYPSSSLMVSPPRSPCHPSTGPIPSSASSTEKAIAALTLAMANGAGSLGDYEAVRSLNVSSTDESQVGELWH